MEREVDKEREREIGGDEERIDRDIQTKKEKRERKRNRHKRSSQS